MGDAYEAVRTRHASPRPTVEVPFETKQEHQQWIDSELEPWRDGQREVLAVLVPARPQTPATNVSDEEWERWDRAWFVYSVLSTTLTLDESITRVGIPFPTEVMRDAGDRDAALEYATFFLGGELARAADSHRRCTDYSDSRKEAPPDLRPWVDHCLAMVGTLVASVCAAEQRFGLEPSVHCSGQRRYQSPLPSAGQPNRSIEAIADRVEQSMLLCDLAEDLLDDDTLEPNDRRGRWRRDLHEHGLDDPELLALVDSALAEEGSGGYAMLRDGVHSLGLETWECPAIETILRGPQ